MKQRTYIYGQKFRKGFSLVEIIVTIGIMAALAAILVPSSMLYVERSRARNDIKAMEEVTNAVRLAMSEPDCLDEMYAYSCTNNYVTYSDSSGEYGKQILDGEYWAPDGADIATTITFNPQESSVAKSAYKIKDGIVNDMTYGNGSVGVPRPMEGAMLPNNQVALKDTVVDGDGIAHTMRYVEQIVSESVYLGSETYKNSSYTIFIVFEESDNSLLVDVYGQFNGTNINPESLASNGTANGTLDGGTRAPEYNATCLIGSGTPSYKLPDED